MAIYKDDIAVNLAIQKARQSFPVFEAAFNSNDPKYIDLCIMIPFPVSEFRDQLWLFQITREKEGYYGVVDHLSDPASPLMGRKMFIEREKLYDWFFMENGLIHGGYTMRIARSRMSEEVSILFNDLSPFAPEEAE